jgi:hypothetical protein
MRAQPSGFKESKASLIIRDLLKRRIEIRTIRIEQFADHVSMSCARQSSFVASSPATVTTSHDQNALDSQGCIPNSQSS